MSAWADENRWYARLMKLAHDLAMDGRGQEAQDLRVVVVSQTDVTVAKMRSGSTFWVEAP